MLNSVKLWLSAKEHDKASGTLLYTPYIKNRKAGCVLYNTSC